MALAATDTCCLARTLAMASPRPLASPRPSPDDSGHEPVTFASSLRAHFVPKAFPISTSQVPVYCLECSPLLQGSHRITPNISKLPIPVFSLIRQDNYSQMMQDQLMTSFVHKSSRGIHTITCSPHHYPTLGLLHVSCQILCKNLFMLMLCHFFEMNSIQFEYCSLCKSQQTCRFLPPKYNS